MKFVGWLTLGLLLGPSLWNVPQPSWYGQLAQIAGGIFLFFAGWEMRFLDLRKDAKFYFLVFLGTFLVPFLAGYFLFSQNLFLAVALGISALPVAIQILKEKGLYDSVLARRTITLASLCDIIAWVILAFLLPEKDMASWIFSHWVVFAFFAGLVVGRFKKLPMTKGSLFFQMWILAPLFFIGLGWKIDIIKYFSFSMFISLFSVALVTKSIGTYVAARCAGESHKSSLDFAILLNARGAMEILAAHYAFNAGLINGEVFAALVMVGIITSLMAVPLVKGKELSAEPC